MSSVPFPVAAPIPAFSAAGKPHPAAGAVFPPRSLAQLDAVYPRAPSRLDHRLTHHPLLELGALVDLAGTLDPAQIEYNPGRLPIGIAPEDVPSPALSPAETIAAIETAGAWLVLKRVEAHPAYAALIDALLAEIAPVVAPRTGAMVGREGFIFVSSPGAVTPFHFDPEHNILLQVRGHKTMTLFPDADEAVFPAAVQEAFHLGRHHRNLPWNDDFAAQGLSIRIVPGEAIHVPVKTPHWVQNGDEVSISLSITWRSEWSHAEADARAFNHVLRKAGRNPAPPAPFPARNAAKSVAWRALRKLGLTGLAG